MDVADIIAILKADGMTPAFIKKSLPFLEEAHTAESFLSLSGKFIPADDLCTFRDEAQAVLNECSRLGIRAVGIMDPDYPRPLLAIGTPPPVLYMKGDCSLLGRVVSIIGTRHSTDLGNRIAGRLGEYFSSRVAVCNGLVEGIDEHVVRENRVCRHSVIGVASGGLDYTKTCSSAHAKNIDDVLEAGGLVVSEFEPSQAADQFSGSKASRIQAGLAQGLILVQSSVTGGSKYTLGEFSRLGRVIGVIHHPSSPEFYTDVFGANRLILEKKEFGIAEILGKKTTKSIDVKEIVAISGKEDYQRFMESTFSEPEALL
jgi:DNA processing protein